MGPEALKGIQETFRASGGYRVAIVIFGLCSLLLLVVLLEVFIAQWRRRRRLQERWRGFTRGMVRRRLSPPQRALLSEMASRQCPEDPGALLQEHEAFECAVHRHMKSLMANEGPGAVQEAADLLKGIRAALGFAAAQGRQYHSTRSLPEGLDVELYTSAHADTPIGRARVGSPREDYLELVELKYAQPISGRTLRVVFYSSGRRFEFETGLLQVDLPNGVCRLAHSIDVRAAEAREHFRITREAPLSVRARWEPQDAWRQAMLRNLSAGGAALVAGFYYETGEQIVLRIQPAEYLDARVLEEEEDVDEREIGARVLETRKLPQLLQLHPRFSET